MILDLANEENDDWIKHAYPGGIENYRKSEFKAIDQASKEKRKSNTLDLHKLAETLLSQHVPFSYENGWIELGSAKSGFKGHKGRPGKRGGSVARGSSLGVSVSSVIKKKLPKALQGIADNAVFVKRTLRAGAAGHAPGQVGDTWVIPVNRDKPDPNTLIHEMVHAHQAVLIRNNPQQHDDLLKEFKAAADEEIRTVRNPLWAADMPGQEIWPSAAGWYYGNAAFMVRESAPKVKAILDRIYGELDDPT